VGRTMTQKLLEAASGESRAAPGDVVLAEVALFTLIDSLTHDHYAWLEEHGLRIAHPDRVVMCFDHFFRAGGRNAISAAHPRLREFAREFGIPPGNVYDTGRQGNTHQLPAEEGLVLPGTCYVGHDTQASTLGAMNAYAIPGLDSTSAALALGRIYAIVPEAIRIELVGELPAGVLGKDVYLTLMERFGDRLVGAALELGGPGLSSIPVDVRLAIANGSNHMGAVTSIFECDEVLREYVGRRTSRPFAPADPDPDAEYAERLELDLSTVEPRISGPGGIERIRPLGELLGTPVDVAYIGSCSGGRLTDLAAAAEVLRGRRVRQGVRLVVTPLTTRVMNEALRLGIITTLAEAGATITAPGCGACFAALESPLTLGAGEVAISASVENFAGRMGSAEASIYLANATVVAASAVAGRIADPAALRAEASA